MPSPKPVEKYTYSAKNKSILFNGLELSVMEFSASKNADIFTKKVTKNGKYIKSMRIDEGGKIKIVIPKSSNDNKILMGFLHQQRIGEIGGVAISMADLETGIDLTVCLNADFVKEPEIVLTEEDEGYEYNLETPHLEMIVL